MLVVSVVFRLNESPINETAAEVVSIATAAAFSLPPRMSITPGELHSPGHCTHSMNHAVTKNGSGLAPDCPPHSVFWSVLKPLCVVGFTLVSRSYDFLVDEGPRPPFPPDHRSEAGERGANSLQQPQESSALQQQFGPRADGALNDDEAAGGVHQPLLRVLSGAEAAHASRPE